MKRILLLVVIFMIVIAGCGKSDSESRIYSEESPEYGFFKSLADSIPVMNPNKKVTLIKLNFGDVTNFDVMPEFYRAVNGQLDLNEVPAQQVKNYISQVAVSLADKNMFMQDADEMGIVVSEEEMQAELEQIWSNPRFGGSEESFKEYVESQGFTMEMVRKDIQEGLKFQKYLEEVIDPQIDVPEELMREAYKEPVSASIRHILLSTQGQSPEEKAETRKKMEDILDKARSGEDFAELAEEYSEDPGSKDNGGLYENFTRGQMVPEFDRVAFSEPVGSITDIVETQFGYHIIKILERESETRPYEEVRDSLREDQLSSLRNAEIEEKLEELKAKYNYNDDPLLEM